MIEGLRVRSLAGPAEEFSSPDLTLCADTFFSVRSIPALPQWHVKDTGHSAKSAGGRLHLNTLRVKVRLRLDEVGVSELYAVQAYTCGNL